MVVLRIEGIAFFNWTRRGKRCGRMEHELDSQEHQTTTFKQNS